MDRALAITLLTLGTALSLISPLLKTVLQNKKLIKCDAVLIFGSTVLFWGLLLFHLTSNLFNLLIALAGLTLIISSVFFSSSEPATTVWSKNCNFCSLAGMFILGSGGFFMIYGPCSFEKLT